MSFSRVEGLTTTKAPFIENMKTEGKLFIEQPYHLYSQENQEAWNLLFNGIQDHWKTYANSRFLEGLKALKLDGKKIPKLEEINRFLEPLTGFQAKAVSGYVPASLFFDCLKKREFPTTITIREKLKLDYLPEPDIFHDIAGHVPMHTDPMFSKILVLFGSLAEMAAKRARDFPHPFKTLENNIRALSRFFWFTVEFGLIQENGSLKGLGSGLLSSKGELPYSITSQEVERRSFSFKGVINQTFEIDHFQKLLFVLDSFKELELQISHLKLALLKGELDDVSPGDPVISHEELHLFLK